MSEKGLTAAHLVHSFAETLALEHVMIGVGSNLPHDASLDMDMPFCDGIPPRTLLERIQLRFKAQYAMEKHNLRIAQKSEENTNPAFAKHVACLETWVWLIQQIINQSENYGAEAGVAMEKHLKDKGQQEPPETP